MLIQRIQKHIKQLGQMSVSLVAASLAFVGCGQNASNTNMDAIDRSTSTSNTEHMSTLLTALGIEPANETNAADFNAVSENLSQVSPVFEVPPSTLLHNVSGFIAQNLWKTQITSTNDIVFYDLANDNNNAGFHYNSNDFNVSSLWLNPYASTQAERGYIGALQNGYYGTKDASGNFSPISHFYVIQYKLRDSLGNTSGNNTSTHYGIVSIPVSALNSQDPQFQLAIFSHAGDYGTSLSEMATLFQSQLANFVVAAPIYPGQAFCSQTALQGVGCVRTSGTSVIPDSLGSYTNPFISTTNLHSMIPIDSPRSPLQEDVNALLGLHNAISKLMTASTQPLNPIRNTSNTGSILKTLVTAANPSYQGPEAIAVGSSNGGTTLFAALGRMGYAQHLVSPLIIPTAADNSNIQYPLFNAAAFFATPSSFVTGELQFTTNALLQGYLGQTEAIAPMSADLMASPYFANYRNAAAGQPVIQEATKDNNNNYAIPSTDPLTNLITFIASSDITFLAPYISASVQNWNTRKATPLEIMAPGSVIFLHGTTDFGVPFTESMISTQAYNTTWAVQYNTTYDFLGHTLGNYFAPLNASFNYLHTPALGVAQYSFQALDQFYNEPCNPNTMTPAQMPDIFYNTNVGRCFGGGYSPQADGTNTRGIFTGHLDASFFTAHLVNNIPDNIISTAVLSSNVTSTLTTRYTIADDNSLGHMLAGIPSNINASSPTFMRYMAAEGGASIPNKLSIFLGNYKPNNTSTLTPFQVFDAWLNSAILSQDKGVFVDYTQ